MRRFLVVMVFVSLLLTPYLVFGQFPPVRRIKIIYPADSINLTQGETSEIPVNVNNTGNVTLANLNVTFETPEGWESGWDLIKFIHMDVNKTVRLNIKPTPTAYGDYNLTIRVISPPAEMNVSKIIKAKVFGEEPPKPPEPQEPPEPGENLTLKSEADTMISKARSSIQAALSIGLDVTSAANVFSRAITSYDEKNYTQAIFFAGLAHNASEQILMEGPPKEKTTGLDYSLILILLVFVIILVGVNKYFL